MAVISSRTTAASTRDNHELTAIEANFPAQNANQDDESIAYPEGGLAAWLVVLGSFCQMTTTYGMMASVGVLQSYWETHQLASYSSSSIGWIPSTFIFLNLALGLQVGPLCDKYGPRWIMLIGSAGWTTAVFLLGSCQYYWQFMLCLGILGGVSTTMVSTPCIAAISHWFNKRRGTATGVALVGSSAGGVAFPVILRAAFARFGWAWAMRILGFTILGFLIIGNLCTRARIMTKTQKSSIDMRCFADKRFLWATLGVSCFELVLFGSFALIPVYALAQGFSAQTGFYLLACFNAGAAFGRIVPGILSDKYGRFNTATIMVIITISLVFILWYPFGHNLAALYSFVTLHGFGTGSCVSLAPVCIGQICRTEEFGRWFGTSYFVVSFAALICIPIGGTFLQDVGPGSLVLFFGGVLGLALVSFIMARWACLDYHWKWQVKI